MNQIEAMYKAKEILGQKSFFEFIELAKEESWIDLRDGWELNIWQDEKTREYKSAVFPINPEGDISGIGIPVYTISLSLEEA